VRYVGLTTIGSVGAVVAGLLVGVTASVTPHLLPTATERTAATFIGVSAAITFGLVGVPLALLVSRRLKIVSEAIKETASNGVPRPLPGGEMLSGVTHRLDRAIHAWADRCSSLSASLRTAELRLSVCEAERQHAEATLHSLHDAVLVTDAFNEVSLANEPAAKLLGFELSESTHRPIDEIIPDQVLRKMIKEVRQSGVLSKQKRIEHSIRGTRLNEANARSDYDVTIACLPDQKQTGVGGVVTILRDITRQKEISEMKSDFVSQASHELRTPLSSINAYIEMLIDAEAQDEASRQEFYQIIKAEADRVSRMIDNMLNISRIEAGIVSAEKSEVDFGKLIHEVLETMQPQARAEDIKLIDRTGPLIYSAQADRDMMFQVVMNLVSNAIKYTPEGGRVTVAVENDDESRSVLVSVSDTGLGIPPDAIDKLFDKFFRIDNYKRIAKGTGLGLNLVKHIVETVHKGSVGVSSEVGMGSRFWFIVPFEFQGG